MLQVGNLGMNIQITDLGLSVLTLEPDGCRCVVVWIASVEVDQRRNAYSDLVAVMAYIDLICCSQSSFLLWRHVNS